MVRGHAKEVAQQKNAQKKQKEAKQKASKGGPPPNQSLNICCQLCKAPFMSKAAKKQLLDHIEAKHAKNKFEECFPGYVEKEGKK
eukprot:g27930.t1